MVDDVGPDDAGPDDAGARFVAIGDIHYDPFAGPGKAAELLSAPVAAWPRSGGSTPPAAYGQDANTALLHQVLGDANARIPAPDFVVYVGDFVVHRLRQKLAEHVPEAGPDAEPTMAVKITDYLAARLAETFPDVPVLPTLGNDDAGCGDYAIEPGGRYLRETFPVVERLVGDDLLAAEAEQTWLAGGYYSAHHPTLPDTRVVVLNTVLWSPEYRNRCGLPGAAADHPAHAVPGEAMLGWLRFQMHAAAVFGERVWLIYHIPPGVDAYATRTAEGSACGGTAVPMWRDRFWEPFERLMTRYRETVSIAFAGHVHRDSWRLMRDRQGAVTAFTAIVPAVSPIYDDAPAYQIVDYDRATGEVVDHVTIAATNLEPASTGVAALSIDQLYRFTSANRQPAYGKEALSAIADALQSGEPPADRSLYARFYMAGHTRDAANDWSIYACAPSYTAPGAFTACACRLDATKGAAPGTGTAPSK